MKKILVVDDYPANRDIFTTLLGDDFEVLEASEGSEALEVARSEKPDMIFLDVSMPGMGGLETIRHVRKDAELYHIPVVAITAHSVFSARKAVGEGCNGYVLKPLTAKKILEKVEEWIGPLEGEGA